MLNQFLVIFFLAVTVGAIISGGNIVGAIAVAVLLSLAIPLLIGVFSSFKKKEKEKIDAPPLLAKNIFWIKGKINRKQFWEVLAISISISILLSIIWLIFVTSYIKQNESYYYKYEFTQYLSNITFPIVGIISTVVITYFLIVASINRCRDRGRSLWFLAIALIPVIGTLWVFIELGFFPARDKRIESD